MAADARQTVVFIDMDHTLLEGPFETAVFPQVLGEIAAKTGLAFETLLRMSRRENLERLSNPDCSRLLAMDWDDIFAVVAGRLGVRLETNALEVVRTHPGSPYSTLHPGAREVLEDLSRARPQRALVLATKGLRKYQLPVLDALGLTPLFDEILTPDSSGALKESLAFYGRWPGTTRLQIMVGDTYEDDVVPASHFGFKTVWRARPETASSPNGDPFSRALALSTERGLPVRPDAVIFSLYELPPIIERMEYESRAV